MKKYFNLLVSSFAVVLIGSDVALAETTTGTGMVAIGAGILMGVAVLGGALGQGKAVSALFDAIGRNPGAAGKLNIPMYVGLAFIEALVVLAFVVAGNVIGLG